METAVPVSYNFSSHDMTAVAHRRMMAPHPDQNIAYYSNPAISYAAPLQSSSYGFGHILNNHPAAYQNFFGSSPQVNSHTRLSSESAPLQQLPDIRHAKNGLSRLIRTSPPKNDDAPAVRPGMAQDKGSDHGESKASLKTEVDFSTEVDTLMKAIQSKLKSSHQTSHPTPHQLPPLQKFNPGGNNWIHPTYVGSVPGTQGLFASQQDRVPATSQKPRRKYECNLPQCRKSFFQKTHLDIHMRAHTGDKPFICKEPSCGQRFSQLGNLKTHERRHTGEKPYSCEICNKKFAQRGNVRAHKITHEQAKPFTCRLDDCAKQFTQLGNLKSHQNKFHAPTLRNLTLRFSSVVDGDRMSPQDRELWDYFSSLYKNSNKGIKGRGKDRRVSSTAKLTTSTDEAVNHNTSGSEDDPKSRSRSYDRGSYIDTSSSDDTEYHQIYHKTGS